MTDTTALIRKHPSYEHEFTREAEGPTHRVSDHDQVKAQLFPPGSLVCDWIILDMDAEEFKNIATALVRYVRSIEDQARCGGLHHSDNYICAKLGFSIRRILRLVRRPPGD